MWRQEELKLGSGQIRVLHGATWYASPNLIVHYVAEHEYRPPDVFLDAVFNGPQPATQEYADALYDLQTSRPLPPGELGRMRRSHLRADARKAAKRYGTRPPERGEG
ncbi:DUF7919 family protein [Enhygromyxa salina]|uniref:DUF7919 family protein n=1 Tax=Enhygromyxa salina TaxID=215803 RepID=UPI0040383F8A